MNVYTGPKREKIPSGCWPVIPALSLGARRRLQGFGAPIDWHHAVEHVGAELVEDWLCGTRVTVEHPMLHAARRAGMLSGTDALAAAVSVADELGCHDVWFVRWGYDAWVFKCSARKQDYALNVARDTTDAAQAVRSAAAWLAEDYARDAAGVARPIGVYEYQSRRLLRSTCPVAVVEWVPHDELSVTARGIAVWELSGSYQPLDDVSVQAMWVAIVQQIARHSNAQYVDTTAIGAGDYVCDAHGAVTRVWSRKRTRFTWWQACATALLVNSTNEEGIIFWDDPCAAYGAWCDVMGTMPSLQLRRMASLFGWNAIVSPVIFGRSYIARSAMEVPLRHACDFIARESRGVHT